jgi:PAS domain S-box-containing protein
MSTDDNSSKKGDFPRIAEDSVLRHLRDAVMVTTLEEGFPVVDWNPAAERMYGWSREEVLGKSSVDVVQFRLEETVELAAQEFEEAGVWRGRGTHARRDGSRFPVEISSSRLLNRDNDAIGSINIIQDRSHDVSMRRQLAEAARLASLGEVAGSVAHELNNPLMAASLQLAMLAEDLEKSMDASTRLRISRIETAVDRCSAIVKGMLQFARHSEAEPRRINLNEVLDLARVVFEPRLSLQETAIAFETEPNVFVDGDLGSLSQVMVNLVVNGAQAMESGGTITVGFRTHDNWAELFVRDEGPGILPEVRERIFEPFFTTKSFDGTGLGLAVSFGIVEEHLGRIVVDSEPGKGATFRVLLPLSSAGDPTP